MNRASDFSVRPFSFAPRLAQTKARKTSPVTEPCNWCVLEPCNSIQDYAGIGFWDSRYVVTSARQAGAYLWHPKNTRHMRKDRKMFARPFPNLYAYAVGHFGCERRRHISLHKCFPNMFYVYHIACLLCERVSHWLHAICCPKECLWVSIAVNKMETK